MKIGIDIRMIGTYSGGIGRYILELAVNLLSIDTDNSYYLFYNKHSACAEDLAVFKARKNAVLVPTGIGHYSIKEQLLLPKILNKYNLDLVHFPNFNVPLIYRKPYVVTIHDMVHHKISGAKKSHIIHFLAYKKVIQNAAKNAKFIITVSESSKKDIVKHLNVPSNKIIVIYEGPALGQLAIDSRNMEEIKRRFLITKPYFLFVGVLERKKNLINLTRGFDVFLQKYKYNFDLVIAGKIDRNYPEIKHKAMDIKFKDHLIFTDFVDDYELKALYQGAYAYVSASLHEGFGLPGIEAMQFGLPLIASNINVFNEIYDNAAIYFNPLDPDDISEKLYLAVRDSQFYAKLQEQSFARGQLFDWQETARQTLQVYQNSFNIQQ